MLGEAFDRSNMLVAGIAQRAPFLLFEQTGGLVTDPPAELTFELLGPDDAAIGPTVTVARGGDDVGRPYYPLVTTWPSPGLYTVRTQAGGERLESAVQVRDVSEVPVPQHGQPLPTAATPTTADPLGAQTLCTREPPCPFHEVSLDAAVAAGPTAALVSTPAFCQFAICGPVLDLQIERAAAFPNLNVVHIEVYPNGLDAGPAPIVPDTFGLQWEPVLFVTNVEGVVVARLDNVWDGDELDAALRQAG